MPILRHHLKKSYPSSGLQALGEAIRYNRLRRKPEWTPYAVHEREIGTEAYQKLLCKERKSWSTQKMVDIINREFGLEGESLCTRMQIRYLEEPSEQTRSPNHTLLHYIASLELVQTVDGRHIFSSFGLDLIAQGLIRWQTGDYLNEMSQAQAAAQKRMMGIRQWLLPSAKSNKC